jgi:hypothetical protein
MTLPDRPHVDLLSQLYDRWRRANSMTALNITVCRLFQRRWFFPLVVALAVVAAGAGPVIAHVEHGHPTRIHEGSCEELGPVAFRLNGVGGSVDLDNAPVATPTGVNADSSYQVLVSETVIDGSIEELLSGQHALMIYESDEAMDAIACGNIGGARTGEMLATGLAEAGVPGHIGFALFRPDGDQMNVLVVLGHGLAPVSASGAQTAEAHADEDDTAHEHEGEEEDGHAAGTPEA